VELVQPTSWEEALAAKSAFPASMPIAGGTDVMVDLNFDRARPEVLLDLTRVRRLRDWGEEGGLLRIGAGVSYTRLIAELGDRLPGLAMAARTIGSPQIRNRGTVGGNLGAASPAGDSHPPLIAAHAEVELASVRGSRRVPVREFYAGPKRNVVSDDELIAAVLVAPAAGAEQFSKIGTRNAMVIAIASLCLILDEDGRTVRVALGSVGPTILRAPEAERAAAQAMAAAGAWDDRRAPLPSGVVADFAERVAAAARPIDDVRGTAAYRRHGCRVLAARALTWALEDRRLAAA
jgi:CO/xanthine dehydrogenase FAD-binding subunit